MYLFQFNSPNAAPTLLVNPPPRHERWPVSARSARGAFKQASYMYLVETTQVPKQAPTNTLMTSRVG